MLSCLWIVVRSDACFELRMFPYFDMGLMIWVALYCLVVVFVDLACFVVLWVAASFVFMVW